MARQSIRSEGLSLSRVNLDLGSSCVPESEQSHGPPVAEVLDPEDCVDGANREDVADQPCDR